jgi:thioredoxin-like negative regulator of GroEL
MKAYDLLRAMWPLPRHYILYSLKGHDHEDIPFRWFQLLIESNEPEAVDRIMEELRAHADDPTFREDLLALVELLSKSSDPETGDKIMQALNDSETPRASSQMLEEFLKTAPPLPSPQADGSVWKSQEQLRSANKKYQAAARLLDAGRKEEAMRRIDDLLREYSGYPFAIMLKALA